MNLSLTFLGAAQNVTGSCYLLEIDGHRILVDCGMYQERDLRARNWDPFPVPPESIEAMLLTHAHLDHCGLIPRLVSHGFSGRIYCSKATADIAEIIHADSAKIQEEDVAFKKRRHEREGREGAHPYEPLYKREDAEAVKSLFAPVPFGKPVEITKQVTAEYFEAGHILGAASIRLTIDVDGEQRRILFSGDIGRKGMPIIRDPVFVEEADYVLIESTYGNRIHEDNEDIPDKLADAVNHAHKAGGNIVIPSFAVERTQDLIYHLHGLIRARRIPDTLIFLDSPMAIRVSEVFLKHPELFDKETMELSKDGPRPSEYPGLKPTRSVEESKAINRIRGSAIIIAGSGMCTGGRVKHHLKNNIDRPECTVLFVGYQAVGTLGRQIVDGAEEIRIHGEMHPIRANVAKIGGFSGHADQSELMEWMSAVKTTPHKVFVTHGEKDAADTLAGLLREKLQLSVHVPEYKETVTLT